MDTSNFRIIDSHVHVGQFFDTYYSPSLLISLMSTVGVTRYAVSSTTMCEENYSKIIDEFHQLITFGGDCVIPVMWITPEGLKGNIAWFLESEINWKCIKIHPELHPNEWTSGNGKIEEVIDIARELRLPLLIHTGNEDCCQSALFERTIAENVDITFILAHGRPLNQAISIVSKYSNAYVDSAFMPVECMKPLIVAKLSHKLLWGTDMCIPKHFFPKEDMAEYYQRKLSAFMNISSQREFEQVTFKNAANLFKIKNTD